MLVKDFRKQYFCHLDKKWKWFIINKGSVVLNDGKYCQIFFDEDEMIPQRIDLAFDTNNPSHYLFKIPKKYLNPTEENFKNSTFRVERLFFERKKKKTVACP